MTFNKKNLHTGVSIRPHHGYHQVDPSPWPALTALCIQFLTVSAVTFFHGYAGAGTIVRIALTLQTYSTSMWWRDVTREGVLNYHTAKVKRGLNLGMVLFIVSERTFFRGLLWAFQNCALMPTVQIGITWPPVGIVPVDTWHLPFRNTQILQLSYFTANRRKHALDNRKKALAGAYQLFTVRQGVIFMYGQYLEYTTAAFTFSDTVYGSSFYLTTGFHGFHVAIGRVYQAVCYFLQPNTTPTKRVAFNLRLLYWHFIDQVWIRLQIIQYMWGSATPALDIERCTNRFCELAVIMNDTMSYIHTTGSMNLFF